MNYEKLLGHLSQQSTNVDRCFAFSIHKAGSTLMNNMITQVCQEEGISAVTIPSIMFRAGIYKVWGDDPELAEYFQHNYLYHGFRFFPAILKEPKLNISDQKFVFLVRDPRDALVSQYFSFSGKNFTHDVNKNNKEKLTQRALSTAHMDIDEYVLHSAKEYLQKLEAYKNGLDFSKGKIFKYEDIYFDKYNFLKDLFAYLDIQVKQATLKKVSDQNDIRPAKEDRSKHIRKGEPGDHRDKLKESTIKELTTYFSAIANDYGYNF